MRIAELPRAQYEGYELVFSYTCRAYYDVRMRDGKHFLRGAGAHPLRPDA